MARASSRRPLDIDADTDVDDNESELSKDEERAADEGKDNTQNGR